MNIIGNNIPVRTKNTGSLFAIALLIWTIPSCVISHKSSASRFHVIAFYGNAGKDLAHISFINEANKWFEKMGKRHHFTYEYTNNWEKLNHQFLSHYQVVIFLGSRPETPSQRRAFHQYMDGGGGWMGFHFAAFALNNSDIPMNWNWYHNIFLGSGSYVSNTWRPTSAILDVNRGFPVTKNLPEKFRSAPNEWYRWSNDLRKNPDIKILLAIDSVSFPLGTGPKSNEIWHHGYYPVAWTNIHYKMIYFNMGHNDMDYEHKIDTTNQTLSYTFDNKIQNKLILNALLWLGNKKQLH